MRRMTGRDGEEGAVAVWVALAVIPLLAFVAPPGASVEFRPFGAAPVTVTAGPTGLAAFAGPRDAVVGLATISTPDAKLVCGPPGIDNLADFIRNSLLYQILGEKISIPDLDALRTEVDGVRQYAGTGITRVETRTFSDAMSLASAINRIWAYVGGSTAVIEDGELAVHGHVVEVDRGRPVVLVDGR